MEFRKYAAACLMFIFFSPFLDAQALSPFLFHAETYAPESSQHKLARTTDGTLYFGTDTFLSVLDYPETTFSNWYGYSGMNIDGFNL
ncbi:MAG: hypothetical protein LBS64_05755, partial [Spirochaetaceae bacterium]|nr:hypothetical protein [Spirochaetaceae bacterium]